MKGEDEAKEQFMNQRFRKIVERSYDGIAILTPGGQISYISPSAERIGGYSSAEIMGQNFGDLVAESSLAEVAQAFTTVKCGGEIQGLVAEIVKKDGSSVWVETNGFPIIIDGEISSIQAVFRDITERKQLESGLRESEEKFRKIVERSHDGIAILTPEGQISYISPSAERIGGYRLDEMTGHNFGDYIAESSLAEIERAVATAMCGEEIQGLVSEIVKKDGSSGWVETNISPIIIDGENSGIQAVFRDVTERKHSEELLRESKERFQALTESTSDWIWEVDADGVYTYASPRVKFLLGYEPEEVIGKTPFDLMPPEEAKHMADEFRAVVESQRPFWGLVNKNLHKDGRSVVLETSGVPFFDATDQLLGYRGIDRDITERKRAEEQLKQKEEHFRYLIENISDVITILDSNGTIRYMSPSCQKIVGYQPNEQIGYSMFDNIHPDDTQRIADSVAGLIQNPDSIATVETRFRHGDGTWHIVEASGVNCLNVPAIDGIIVNFRDITERKQSEEALRKSQERLQSMIQAIPDMLLHISRDGTFLDEPMGTVKILDRYRGAFSEKSVYDLLADDHADNMLKAIETALDHDALNVLEFQMPIPPETEAIYETRIVPCGRDEVLAIARNITDQKQFAERLRAYQQQLRSLTAQLSQAEEQERKRLATDIHDSVSQPLAVIKMKLNAWKDTLYSSGLAAELREVIELLESAIHHSRSLTYELGPPVLYELGLEAGLEALLEQFQERHAIRYEYEDDGQRKPLQEEISVLLYRCVSELLMNVVKHARAQTIKLSIYREDSQVSIDIEDDGIGFDTSETEVKAKGFGLFSIRERLNSIGGSLELKSEPGCGTCATLKAPLKHTADNIGGD